MKRMACVLALATGTGTALGVTAFPALAEPAPAAFANGLQIAIASPASVTDDSTISLDVSFRGGNVRSLELYVDGSLVRKQSLRTRDKRGVISLALEGLPEGSHEVLIKALEEDGTTATATTRLKVAPADIDALVRFQFPKRNAMVEGVIPIQVDIDKSIRKPYITFFVDNDFLAFINLAPYTYNWDSSHVSNGPHIINVKVYDGESLAEVKSVTMKINVNNPGGFTNRQNETPDLSKPTRKEGPVANAMAEAASSLPGRDVPVQLSENGLLRMNKGPRTLELRSRDQSLFRSHLFSDLPASELLALLSGSNLLRQPAANAGMPLRLMQPGGASAFAAPSVHSVEPRVNHGIPASRPGVLGVLSAPADTLSLIAPTMLSRQTLRPRHTGNIAAMPGLQLTGRTTPVRAVAPSVAVSTKNVKSLLIAGDLSALHNRTFNVAFDSARIAFDVAPRVENGLPLAPFRQIFEHTGGKIKFFNQSKTVRAFNNEREIEFRMGEKEAKVNNQTLSLEAKPYIEKGRAIVPLSFIRDAMDVKVSVDAATGRIVIESNK